MAESRGNYEELTEFSSYLYDHAGSTPGQTPGQTPSLHQRSFSGTEPLISPPTTYQPSPDLSDDPNRSKSYLNTPSGSQGAWTQAPFTSLRDSSFHENLSPEEYKSAGAISPRAAFNG